jgi:hypothetical protein
MVLFMLILGIALVVGGGIALGALLGALVYVKIRYRGVRDILIQERWDRLMVLLEVDIGVLGIGGGMIEAAIAWGSLIQMASS